MLLSANRLVDALVSEFRSLSTRFDDANVDGSAAQGIAAGLQLLRNREQGDAAAVRRQIEALRSTATRIAALADGRNPAGAAALQEVARPAGPAGSGDSLSALEDQFRQLLAKFEDAMAQIGRAGTLDRAAIARAAVEWESQYLLDQAAAAAGGAAGAAAVRFDAANLQAYLRDRLGDASIVVTAVQPLAGGFGKETTIFSATGAKLSGEFVIRRDMPGGNVVDNDCHLIDREFPILQAARAHGFPAPDALWLDTAHELLPGGHFLVMRRSPGRIGGNFFGAQTRVPENLADALAATMAKLHALPPMPELGDLTDSIRRDTWSLDRRESIRRYLQAWLELYRSRRHAGSPAVLGLYGWLLEHVPERHGRPALLHGDFGFHNFLFHEGELSAVLDWEFAHVGDPAEDLGYVKVTVGAALDWDRLMARYLAAGGEPVDERTLLFFQIWAYVRNASAASLLWHCFDTGQSSDLKLTVLPHAHFPHFIRGAQALVDAYEQRFGS